MNGFALTYMTLKNTLKNTLLMLIVVYYMLNLIFFYFIFTHPVSLPEVLPQVC